MASSDSCELYSESIQRELKSNGDVNGSKQFCESVKSFISKYSGIEKVCWEVASYLSYIGNKLSDDNKVKTYCSYVKYLLYDEIIKNKEITNHYEILITFNIPWNTIISNGDFNKKENCRPEFPNIPIHYDEKWKKMFDYCINYDPIQRKLSSENSCAKSYCQYIDENKGLYTEFKELCANHDEYYCPSFFQECEKNIPNNILVLPACEEYNKSLLPKQGAIEEATGQASGDTLRTSNEDHPSSSDHMKTSPSLHSNTTMLTIFPTLSVLVTSLLMYKVTPFGSWLRPHLQKMTKLNNSSVKESIQSSYETEYIDINSNEGSYNIAYYSGENL
ncbi:PIR Superfamily Protein [Plasmodium ovale wallikeri]|uniref:Plasmodium vivax Vir protein, putative n=2 Tax=Plasmodium ovale TaxID=36330 RepID=A0A1C3KJ32_PLAOA|nr:PIR Superfamily Protein [Plasmodium ovale wallikeri]SBT73884.1 Plasmodium vivax Vir protein, putative [Plasmodium ovale]